MPCLVLLDKLGDVALQHGVGFFQSHRGGFHDEGFGDFARAVVGDGDHRAVGDGGVAEQEGFEFGGGDLEALE